MANYGIQFKDKDGNNYYPCPFPVGSIYMSVNEVNPKVYFGGEWNRITGCYLMAYDPNSTMPHKQLGTLLGDWYTSTAGHALTERELPSHRHSGIYSQDGAERYGGWGETSTHTGTLYEHGLTQWEHLYSGWVGANEAHSHQMFEYYPVPTLTVNVWKRVA